MIPKLSIITPVKNAAPWLAECIESCLKQSFTDWEWIFVDDHSSDNSYTLVSAFAEMDARIQIHKNHGEGIIKALSKALELARGRYVTRMDADDIMPEDRLRLLVNALENSPAQTVVTGLVAYFPKKGLSEGYKVYENWLNEISLKQTFWHNIYRECVIASPNWMMRMADLQAVGGFKNLNYPEDYDLVLRWYAAGFRIKGIPQLTLYWREHSLRTSRNSELYSQQQFFKLKLQHFLQLDYSPARHLILWGTGVKAKLTATILLQKQVQFIWMDLKPHLYPKGLLEQPILPFTQVEQMSNYNLLLAVYPPPEELKKLNNYLEQLQLTAGQDYWYL